MNLISKAIFINSHTSEVIVEIVLHRTEIGFEIIRTKPNKIDYIFRATNKEAIEYYNDELIGTRKGLTAMEVIYEIRS